MRRALLLLRVFNSAARRPPPRVRGLLKGSRRRRGRGWRNACCVNNAGCVCAQLSVQQRVSNIANELLHTEMTYVSKLHLLDQVETPP